jgi:hypothetical protein
MAGTTVRSPEAPAAPAARGHAWAGTIMGLVCAGVAIGVAQLVAGLLDPATSPIVAVGSSAIDATPEWLKSFAIRTFGSNDKTVLLGGIGAVLAIVAAVVGVIAIRRPRVGYVALGILGVVGVLASLTRPGAGPADALPALLGPRPARSCCARSWRRWSRPGPTPGTLRRCPVGSTGGGSS